MKRCQQIIQWSYIVLRENSNQIIKNFNCTLSKETLHLEWTVNKLAMLMMRWVINVWYLKNYKLSQRLRYHKREIFTILMLFHENQHNLYEWKFVPNCTWIFYSGKLQPISLTVIISITNLKHFRCSTFRPTQKSLFRHFRK